MRDEKIGEAMDDLLKASARQALAPPTPLCVDAERLAAWSDGALPRSEAETVEVHLAGCARCQAMLATLAATIPSQPTAVVVPFRHRWQVRWVAPIAAAAAAAVLVWVALPGNRPSEESAATTMARAEPPAAFPAEPPALQAPSESGSVGAGSGRLGQGQSRTQGGSAASDLEKAGDPRLLTRSAQSATPSERRAENGGNRMVDGLSAMPAGSAPERQPAASPPASAPSSATASPPPPPPPPPPAPPAALAAPRMASTERVEVADTVAVRAQSGERSFAVTFADPLEIVAAPPRLGGSVIGGAGRGGAGRGGQGRSGALQAASAPPPPPTRWRVLPNGRIERSTSGGSSWEPAGPTAFAGLIAGVAPSNSVCWIVGRSGLVLRSTDGLTFARVPFPEPVDLLTITAVDARQATVTTATGNTYTTTDGGASWN